MSDMNWTRIISLIGPLFLTFSAFWVYFKGKALKERGAKLSPFLWAILVYFLFIITFPAFLILKETKWKKEAIGITPSHKMNQWQRILVIVIFFVIYVFTVLLIPFINTKNQQEISNKSNIVSSEKKTVDETVDWNTYVNEDIGFEIKYSPTYENDPRCIPRISSTGSSLVFMGPITLGIETMEDMDLEKYVDKYIKDSEYDNPPFYNKVISREKILLDGESAEKIAWDFMGMHPSSPRDIFLKKVNNIYHFQYDKRTYPGSCLLYEDQLTEELVSLMLSTFKFIQPTNETKKWQTYNSGQEIMGFSLNIPTEWTVNITKGEYIFPDELSGVSFDFAPPEWSSLNYSYSYMGWGAFYVKFYNPETDINKWIDKHLADVKDGLTVTKEGQIGGKSIFTLNKGKGWDEEKLGVVWNPYHVILGTEYSYSYGFSQDGANNFVQIIKEKIFPNISIK